MPPPVRIVVVSKKIAPAALSRLVGNPYPGMVKFVVDLDRKPLAAGGRLHVDAETILLDQGSRQEALWGGNYFPGLGEEDCLEFTSMINIRPAQDNRTMDVRDPRIREKIRAVVFALLGRGEPLP
jgi:hypothetical protein